MSIAVVRMGSRNNVLTHMGEQLLAALTALGVDAWAWTLSRDDSVPQIMATLEAARTHAVIAFGSGGAEWTDQAGVSPYTRLGCAFVGWDVDHPGYDSLRASAPIARRVKVCASASHLRFAERLGSHAQGCLMLPGVEMVAAEPLPISARPVHALAALSWMGEPQAWWTAAKGTPVHDLVETMVARVLADPAVDLLAAFDATLEQLGIEAPINAATCELFAKVGLFVRQYDRLRLAEAFAGLDMPRVLCGRGWQARFGDRPGLFYAEDLDYLALTELYGQARVVVNANAANGASERAMTAMAAGAIVASDYSPLVEQELRAPGGLRFYDRRDMASLAEPLGLGCAGPEAQRIADLGRATAAEHLWTGKAERLVERIANLPVPLAPGPVVP